MKCKIVECRSYGMNEISVTVRVGGFWVSRFVRVFVPTSATLKDVEIEVKRKLGKANKAQSFLGHPFLGQTFNV